MPIVRRLMLLLDAFLNPTRRPLVNDKFDRRLDRVDSRLKVLSPESARRARDVVHQGR